jgi:hypothetical protein
MNEGGCWMLDAGYWILDAGYGHCPQAVAEALVYASEASAKAGCWMGWNTSYLTFYQFILNSNHLNLPAGQIFIGWVWFYS